MKKEHDVKRLKGIMCKILIGKYFRTILFIYVKTGKWFVWFAIQSFCNLLVSNSLIVQIKSININKDPRGREKPSDHTPIEIKLA